ncbi:MAG TPA: hypothetical protein PKK23_08655 [Nitrospirales bacterium]|nr:hypothetical protein [Nitrospirales bacterium]
MRGQTIRTKNQFGKRFISWRNLSDYMVDLDLISQSPGQDLLEYLEREGLLYPVARVRFPGEIARRFEMGKYPSANLPPPIEGDTLRLKAATELRNELFWGEWGNPKIYGERKHLLDAGKPEHDEFIQKDFVLNSFIPWEDHRTLLWLDNGKEVFDGLQYSPTYYHYWQIFALAAILRSGLSIIYPLEDKDIGHSLWEFNNFGKGIRKRIYRKFNIEARHELNNINQHKTHFEAVGYFKAYKDNALRVFYDQIDRRTGGMPNRTEHAYRKREREIARNVLGIFSLTASDLLDFVGQQAEWWDNARRVGPAAIAEEYARNISETIHLYSNVTGENFDRVSERIGRRGGWFEPILDVIFPSWLREQRDLTKRSLKNWAATSRNELPSPLLVTDVDIDSFCNWLEKTGLYQYYWHFSRFSDIHRNDSPIYRAAAAAETVAFANLVELIANEAYKERGFNARGNTLWFKLRQLFDSSGPTNLFKLLKRYQALTNTNKSTLKIRLAQIDRIQRGGSVSPVLRAFLKLLVIRNEGSHLGLNRFDRITILDMLETMSMASLMIWKARIH